MWILRLESLMPLDILFFLVLFIIFFILDTWYGNVDFYMIFASLNCICLLNNFFIYMNSVYGLWLFLDLDISNSALLVFFFISDSEIRNFKYVFLMRFLLLNILHSTSRIVSLCSNPLDVAWLLIGANLTFQLHHFSIIR